jgi:hypothetical protein
MDTSSITAERTLTGRAVCVNENGLKFEGAGAWLNVSKFATGVVLPQKGETVTVTLDKSGFIRSISGSGCAPSPARVAGGSDVPAASSTKDRTITRLAVLKAAAEYAASKPDSKSTDVLAIAAAWEKWVLRDDAPDDLTDAF